MINSNQWKPFCGLYAQFSSNGPYQCPDRHLPCTFPPFSFGDRNHSWPIQFVQTLADPKIRAEKVKNVETCRACLIALWVPVEEISSKTANLAFALSQEADFTPYWKQARDQLARWRNQAAQHLQFDWMVLYCEINIFMHFRNMKRKEMWNMVKKWTTPTKVFAWLMGNQQWWTVLIAETKVNGKTNLYKLKPLFLQLLLVATRMQLIWQDGPIWRYTIGKKTLFGEIQVESKPEFDADIQAYAAGFIEGHPIDKTNFS